METKVSFKSFVLFICLFIFSISGNSANAQNLSDNEKKEPLIEKDLSEQPVPGTEGQSLPPAATSVMETPSPQNPSSATEAAPLQEPSLETAPQPEPSPKEDPLHMALGALERKEFDVAFRRFQTLAEQGNPEASYNLGLMYASGEGTTQDYAKARESFLASAEAGFALSAYQLGIIYEKALGVDKDMSKSMEWLQKAADAGIPDAQLELGNIYAEGYFGTPDVEKAKSLYLQAAKGNLAEAAGRLSAMHEYGLGVEKDNVQALKWAVVAWIQGDPYAMATRRRLEEGMNQTDKEIAKKEAIEWTGTSSYLKVSGPVRRVE